LIGIAIVIAILPFLMSLMLKVGASKEKETMFLEFSRNLVESVKTGIPISRSIINISNKNFGSLTPHVKKLANQIILGIPVRDSLKIFAGDIGSPIIARSVELITEAEHSGGEIGKILDSVATSVSEIEEIKKERKASVYSLVMQGYIIFFIFIVIMLVVQYKFIPQMTQTISSSSMSSAGSSDIPSAFSGGKAIEQNVLSRLFLVLMLVQGFFAGLVTGKLSEGNIQAGLKHSFILVALSYLLTTFVGAFAR
jgi:flagellar protein FlaJ